MRKPSSHFSSGTPFPPVPDAAAVALAFHRGWVVDPQARLRVDDLLECEELAGFLGEVALALRALPRTPELTLIDAAAGRGLVGVLATHFFFQQGGVRLRLVERDPHSLARGVEAAGRLVPVVPIEVSELDLADAVFGARPDLVTALHACGDASDLTIASAIRAEARRILVAPCCVARHLASSERAVRAAERSGLPTHGELLRLYIEAWVMGERVIELERAGYQTEVVSFTSSRVTPHHLVLRARRVMEPVRMARAEAKRAAMHALAAEG
jgi:hypothetical protein